MHVFEINFLYQRRFLKLINRLIIFCYSHILSTEKEPYYIHLPFFGEFFILFCKLHLIFDAPLSLPIVAGGNLMLPFGVEIYRQ